MGCNAFAACNPGHLHLSLFSLGLGGNIVQLFRVMKKDCAPAQHHQHMRHYGYGWDGKQCGSWMLLLLGNIIGGGWCETGSIYLSAPSCLIKHDCALEEEKSTQWHHQCAGGINSCVPPLACRRAPILNEQSFSAV
jgi:hypothetical protein